MPWRALLLSKKMRIAWNSLARKMIRVGNVDDSGSELLWTVLLVRPLVLKLQRVVHAIRPVRVSCLVLIWKRDIALMLGFVVGEVVVLLWKIIGKMKIAGKAAWRAVEGHRLGSFGLIGRGRSVS